MAPPLAPDLFPIRTVSSLTGVNVITLRAWERRYGLIKPTRTASGHRLYRRDDIDRIHQALALLNKGVSIGQVKHALEENAAAPTAAVKSPWVEFQSQMVSAIVRFDEDRLEEIYNQALSVYTIEQVTEQLLTPLLVELGRRWESSEGNVAEEHFFGVYLRNKLGARFHHRTRGGMGPRVLCACLPGERHENGLMLFALAAHERGLQPVLLGADTPLEELADAARRARCEAIVLSGSIELAPHVLRQELPTLARAAAVPVFVGGLTSTRERDAIVAAGAMPLGTQLSSGIERIRSAASSVKQNK